MDKNEKTIETIKTLYPAIEKAMDTRVPITPLLIAYAVIDHYALRATHHYDGEYERKTRQEVISLAYKIYNCCCCGDSDDLRFSLYEFLDAALANEADYPPSKLLSMGSGFTGTMTMLAAEKRARDAKYERSVRYLVQGFGCYSEPMEDTDAKPPVIKIPKTMQKKEGKTHAPNKPTAHAGRIQPVHQKHRRLHLSKI